MTPSGTEVSHRPKKRLEADHSAEQIIIDPWAPDDEHLSPLSCRDEVPR